MNKTKTMKEQFEDLLAFDNIEERFEHEAQMLAFEFLSKVDLEMAKTGMSKKVLAEKVGTSAAFITQMFQGDRKPSWTMLAKMQDALNLHFQVMSSVDSAIDELNNFHNFIVKREFYQPVKNDSFSGKNLMHVVHNNDYALAG